MRPNAGAPMRRLTISLKRRPVITVDRTSIGRLKLAYVILADKKVRYPKGRSKIVYIGTTKRGINRVAWSAAVRSEEIFSIRGVSSFEARMITCKARQRVRTWHQLERALLIEFTRRFGSTPRCNSHGKRFKERKEFLLFSRRRIATIIDDLS
jgi:hypothetical protein